MICVRKIMTLLIACILLFFCTPAGAVQPDFNADRRVNIKCPTTVDKDREGQFEPDKLMNTLKRLYHELDQNLKAAERKAAGSGSSQGYVFSTDPNEGIFFVAHAKASFSAGGLSSFFPKDKIEFQEVFYIKEINWDSQQLTLVRKRDKKKFTVDIPDFEKTFLWYNALLDKQRAYIPVYGFLSLPGEAQDFPTIWNSWQSDRKDTATPAENLVDYDFYKILDYQDGYYLLGKDFNELDYRENVEDFGIIGWVEKKYITLWRSRLYYHPLKQVKFFDQQNNRKTAKETNEINNFYVQHIYLKERLFNDIVEKLDQESLHKFYAQFGFPQLTHPENVEGGNFARVFIPGAFTPRLMRLLGNSIKENLNAFFLIDVSESMRPFADYVKAFNKSIQGVRQKGIGLSVNRVYAYWDSATSDRDMNAEPNFIRVKKPENIEFVHKTGDRNFAEPLARAFAKVLYEIESLQNDREILPLQEKLLFVITDAGPNDLTDKAFADMVKRSKQLNLRVYFVYPGRHGVRKPNSQLDDNPGNAYQQLEDTIARFESSDTAGQAVSFRRFKFETASLQSEARRQDDFLKHNQRLIEGIESYIDHVFINSASGDKLSKDVILYFSDENLLGKIRKWTDRKIQVLNHVVKYIDEVGNPEVWEERIAIPAKPVESYLRAVKTQDDVTLSDLKKLVIINSLVSVDEIEKCRKLYDHIKPLIEMKTLNNADAVFYRALTNKEAGQKVQWNRSLGGSREKLGDYISERGFHLNSFNQAVQRKFMYLKVGELYTSGQ
ncbi:MAG: VWA domain-containing protein [Desulfobacterales bacterium]|nr:VWA domain-containing protein [Desulfobacterales bacterium]